MGKPTKLKIGRSTIVLTPSETLVAVAEPPEGQRPRGFGPAAAEIGGEEVMRLGGFSIISVEKANIAADGAVRRLALGPNNTASVVVYHTSGDGVPFVPTGEIYIEFSESASPEQANKVLKDYKLEYVKASGKNGKVVRLTVGDSVEVCARLQTDSNVEVAEPSLATPAALRSAAPASTSLPTDALLDQQWHLRNTGQINGDSLGLLAGADARVVNAWRKANQLGSPEITVAVIDDGFDVGHPDLGPANRIVSPFDFSRNSTDVRPAPGDWHGTACAGVAVARADADGVVGAAPNCKLMPIRWGTVVDDNQIESQFGHATNNGADIVSCSWGVQARVFHLTTRMHNAIEECATRGRGGLGCVIVFAAGNAARNINNPPSSVDGFSIHPNVIAVSASTSVDTRSDYSNFGREISVCAPSSGAGGRGVLTTDVRGTYVAGNGTTQHAGYSPGPFTSQFGGTSSSCPLVAGICALALSIKPDLTSAEVKSLLERTARKIGSNSDYDQNGHSQFFGFGCVDAEAMVVELLGGNGGQPIA